MQQTTNIEITRRMLQFLSSIEAPVLVEDFIRLELTGDSTADALLSKVSRTLLEYLGDGGLINSDSLLLPNPKIYGLSSKGLEMQQLFLKLTNA